MVLGGLPFQPLKNLQEAYRSRTAHHVLMHFARENHLVLDLLYLTIPSPFARFILNRS